jgi:transposase
VTVREILPVDLYRCPVSSSIANRNLMQTSDDEASWECLCFFPSGVGGIMCLTVIEGRAMARSREDPKVQALRAERSLNPRPEAVSDERFASSEFLDARDLVQVKYEMVRRARVEGEVVGRAAAAFGFSRPSFYAAQSALDEGGLAALVGARPGPRRAHKLTEEIVAFARERLQADPSLRSVDLVEVIAERFGVRVHPRSVERALARADRSKSERGDGR